MIPEGAIISGFISKIVNDFIDVTKDKIRKADRDRKAENQSFETRIYQVIIDAFNEFTYGEYKDKDILYDLTEKLVNNLKRNKKDKISVIKSTFFAFGLQVNVTQCENFIKILCHEISREKNFDVYKEVVLINQGQEIEYNHNILQCMDKKIDYLSENILEKDKNLKENDILQKNIICKEIKSRTQEYADKWNANMFLNDFNKRDENAGVNVKLSEVYLEEHLPHYTWRDNIEEGHDLKDLLSEYINVKDKNKMLLILGHPGIGKSTLITWVIANFPNYINNFLVYQFASDLKNIEWQNISENYNLVDDMLTKLSLSYDDLYGKTLIFDGFDEVRVENRIVILNKLYWELINNRAINNFSLIVTCRENYVENLIKIDSDYIILQAWNDTQIHSFCKVYQEITKVRISHNTISNLIKNQEILGIPLILYMVLGLNISIEDEYSIVGVYDKIFSLGDGGIYARCLQNKRYETPHRINEIRNQIHQISREIAMWMFENKPEEASIPQGEYEKICNRIMKDYAYEKTDFKIGNYFKSVKHCEGIETEELSFVHRSIYEYFVAETIYSSIKDAMIELTEESQKEFAGKIANYLKKGRITSTISEYFQFKIIKFYDIFCGRKWNIFYQWWESAIEKMISNGMFYYTGGNIQQYKNIMDKEILCFLNLVKILRKVFVLKINKGEYMFENVDKKQLEKYIRFRLVECRMEERHGAEIFNLDKISLEGINLSGADTKMANLQNANLKGADLSNTDLSEKNLQGVDLRGANLENTNLQNANLKWANLVGVKLDYANLQDTIFDESQIFYLRDKFCLDNSKVYVFDEKKIISYKSYCERIKN
ncbi:pentapeptide repeat-containing protein [Bacteroides acidifaciens]|uniref:pentapeptide repeat-containing protein n=1 Tax=Bacteroides acidifaciens TaxID=85831 RepID=UPI0035C20FBB